jgi:hypothetical protein
MSAVSFRVSNRVSHERFLLICLNVQPPAKAAYAGSIPTCALAVST